MAKAEFNLSLEVLLESRYGARTVPRIREHFDRLVERISAYELTASHRATALLKRKYEPATIDDLLTSSTFEQPPQRLKPSRRSRTICRRRLTTSTFR
jgi:hypothetical protein